MNERITEVRQRLNFIDRTICHAAQACHTDDQVPKHLVDYVRQLSLQSGRARQALIYNDANAVRQQVDHLARLSDRAQNAIHPADSFDYAVKSAVILTHLEVSALRLQLG